ncbi:hypothetical protein KUV57_22855 [Epibacterium sp. DP7N7-1]|nr:hypothetical protein [Epibacterium sp. DP7N7-1]
MSEIVTVGLDLVKSLSQVHGVDAETICEAALPPTMPFVSVKSEETQGAAMVCRVSELLIRYQLRAIIELRGHLAQLLLDTATKLSRMSLFERSTTWLPTCAARWRGTREPR